MSDETTRVVIKGIRPYDGEYELDIERAFNSREWRWVKQISGYLPMTLDEGLKGGDPSVFIAMAVIAMARAYKIEPGDALEVAQRLEEAPFDGAAIQIVSPDIREDDDLPLASTSPPDGLSPSETDSSPNGTERAPSGSGTSSNQSSDLSDVTQAPIGTSGSVPPVVSGRTGSAE